MQKLHILQLKIFVIKNKIKPQENRQTTPYLISNPNEVRTILQVSQLDSRLFRTRIIIPWKSHQKSNKFLNIYLTVTHNSDHIQWNKLHADYIIT